jgi:chemotaxis protein MotB
MDRKRIPAYSRPHQDRWLVSYADFITILLALFVVLFAASNADQQKAGRVAIAVKGAFRNLGVFAGNSTPSGAEASDPAVPSSQSEMEYLKAKLQLQLASSIESGSVRVIQDFRGLTISLTETGFFAAGSAIVQPEAYPSVDQIAATLREVNNHIRVEGHTDNTPIHTAVYPSNWELSTDRAIHILQYLVFRSGISPRRLSAAGYAEYRPIAPNDTVDGRALNRRVDLVTLSSSALEPEGD